MNHKKQNHHLTREQESILYGTLLGGSSLYPKGSIQIQQCINNKEYILWLFDKLKSLTTRKPPRVVLRRDKPTGKKTQSLRFYTRRFFTEWRSLFYNDQGLKILPENFSRDLDSLSLAIWFLDDGGKCSNGSRGVFLTVDNYTHAEILRIQETMRVRFGIHAREGSSGKTQTGLQQKRLLISGDNYEKFKALVFPFIQYIPSMLRKLP